MCFSVYVIKPVIAYVLGFKTCCISRLNNKETFIMRLKKLKQEEESTIENYKLLKEKVNEFLEFKELNSLIVHKVIYNFC